MQRGSARSQGGGGGGWAHLLLGRRLVRQCLLRLHLLLLQLLLLQLMLLLLLLRLQLLLLLLVLLLLRLLLLLLLLVHCLHGHRHSLRLQMLRCRLQRTPHTARQIQGPVPTFSIFFSNFHDF